MRKLIVCLLGTLILSQPIHAHNLAEVIENALPSITYIEVERHIERKVIDTQKKSVTVLRERSTPSAGTGFVIEDNKVVTNWHVISRAVQNNEKVYVKFDKNNGVRYEATIIGYDEVADVALLQIDGKHPSLKISKDSSKIRMGEEIFTISNYYSIRHSASVGIVSSNNRADRRFPYVRLLQLQILQGSGSSGGPVLNDRGEVVALNHTILSMVPDNVYKEGTIPSLMSMSAWTIRGDQIARSVERIKREGVVKRMDIGVYLQGYGMNTERYLYDPVKNSSDVSGLLVVGPDKGVTTDLQRNDIIVSVDGERFTNVGRFLTWLDRNKEEGDTVKIQLYRNGAMLNITTEVKAARRFR